ncbi:hypothetical protein GCM10010524_37580 [Streptomyces mexicanus]
MDGRAQPAHGGRRVQSVPDDVAHHQRGPCPGQRDHVEPVAPHAGPSGQVPVGRLHSGGLRQGGGQQAALERHGRVVLVGVAAGVVDGERRTGGQLLREGDVFGFERR